MKVEIFENHDYVQLEATINLWLATNDNIEIKHTLQSVIYWPGEKDGGPVAVTTISIWYDCNKE